MKNLLDIDLDYFNTVHNPAKRITHLIDQLPDNIPTVFVIEHHEILPYVNKWIKNNTLSKKFHWYHIDEHHDFYGKLEDQKINCATFGYFMPYRNIRSMQWILPKGFYIDGEEWRSIKKHINFSACIRRGLGFDPSDIGAVAFTLSPDYIKVESNCKYMYVDKYTYMDTIIGVILGRFNMDKFPICTNQNLFGLVNAWKYYQPPCR